MVKVILIDVAQKDKSLAWQPWVDSKGRFAMPSVGLISIASLVPDEDDVSIIDEKVEEVTLDPASIQADLIGLSYKTMYAKRAYALADAFRARGITVVMGGIHATLQYEEALPHANAVVIGEGETQWPKVINDFKNNTLHDLYSAPNPPTPIDVLPVQRYELLNNKKYITHAIHSARGCSFACEFCPTKIMFGEGCRLRNADSVLEECKCLLEIEEKPIFFTENIFGAGNLHYIKNITGRLKAIGACYAVICDWIMVSPELVKILTAHQCSLVMINMTGRRTKEEEKAISELRSAGIAVWGYVMFGFEEDTPDVFQGAIDMARKYELSCISITVLAPYPNTPMGIRLKNENRIITFDTDLYDQSHVIIEPKQMTLDELMIGYKLVCQELEDIISFPKALNTIFKKNDNISTRS